MMTIILLSIGYASLLVALCVLLVENRRMKARLARLQGMLSAQVRNNEQDKGQEL